MNVCWIYSFVYNVIIKAAHLFPFRTKYTSYQYSSTMYTILLDEKCFVLDEKLKKAMIYDLVMANLSLYFMSTWF